MVILSLILLQTTLDFIVAQSISFDLCCCFIQSIIMEKSKLTFCTYRYLHIFINLIQQYLIYAIYVNIMIQIAIFYYLEHSLFKHSFVYIWIFSESELYEWYLVLQIFYCLRILYLISLSIDDMQFNGVYVWLLNQVSSYI